MKHSQNHLKMCMIKRFNIGTLNTRGISKDFDRKVLAKDALKYDLQACGVQETHLKHQNNLGLEDISASISYKTRKYKFFYTGEDDNKYHGVGLLVNSELNPTFKRVSNRICYAQIKLKERNLYIVSAYAPTLSVSEKQPHLREQFYDELDSTVRLFSSRHLVVVLGDFNAKTGSGFLEFKDHMGMFGKGLLNSNGRFLLEFAAKNNLTLTNTLFYHKLAHVTTWTCPERKKPHNSWDGTKRRNPYRNQVDYILVRNEDKHLVQNARSYGGTETISDHKLVIANVDLKHDRTRYTKSNSSNSVPRVNIDKLQDLEIRKKYQNELSKQLDEQRVFQNCQDQWTHIVKACHQAGKEILGEKPKTKKHEDEKLRELSQHQKKIKLEIENTTSKAVRGELRTKRNKIMKDINKRIKVLNDETINNKLEQIESFKDDSRRCFQATKQLNQMKPKKSLIVYTEDESVAGSEAEQVKAITKHFHKMFTRQEKEEIEPASPTTMTNPFTSSEIERAAKSMKNQKSCGEDNLNAEYIKYGSKEVHEEIASLLNKIAETGDYPKEMKSGILNPLPKQGKKQGPPENLRPIILLSTIRKLLAICMIRRTWDRLKTKIPIDQAAYQSGRSTTEHVLAFKLLCEKAITSSMYFLYALLLDMSKAFDTVCRKKLMNDLKSILEPDEYHMLSILIMDVKLKIRVGQVIGEEITTEIGIAQGDCLSAVLFIFYLAITLNKKETTAAAVQDHGYLRIDPKYADDITYLSTKAERNNKIEKEIPSMLKERNLFANHSKTEKETITRGGDENWKNIKFLGSLLDTENDINRRKGIAIAACDNMKDIFYKNKNSTAVKMRCFQAYVAGIFLYNSEVWTVTELLNHKIDVFQRKLLRRILNIKWTRKISNIKLYEIAKSEPWSVAIKRKRLSFLGHVMRLDPETPARMSISEFLRPVKRPQGRPKKTWMEIVRSDLKEVNIELDYKKPKEAIDKLVHHAQNREWWRGLVRLAVPRRANALP